MDKNKDVYGHEILAYLKGTESYEIIERDDGYIGPSGGPKNYFAEYNNWPSFQKEAIKFAKGRVLDIGCGAGRVGIYLKQKGFDYLGIDNSPLAVEVCKKRGLKARRIPIDNISVFKPNSFDTIIMLGNNFGLFQGYKKAKTLLNKMRRITSNNAIIIAESLDPYKTKEKMHLEYHKFNKRRGRMPGQLRIRGRFQKILGDWFDYLLVSKKEMKEIVDGTGWKIKKFIDKKPSYIAIIEKAKSWQQA
ncbi:MAG TPA: class I SAM-dependent methyltransferase [Candidatus Woesearchaeota archaeon]|nr:class I SAM-dependent methyltransferase [Candidatus Woesearchaeota archaeon]